MPQYSWGRQPRQHPVDTELLLYVKVHSNLRKEQIISSFVEDFSQNFWDVRNRLYVLVRDGYIREEGRNLVLTDAANRVLG